MQVHQQKKKLGSGGREEPPHRARNKRVLKRTDRSGLFAKTYLPCYYMFKDSMLIVSILTLQMRSSL